MIPAAPLRRSGSFQTAVTAKTARSTVLKTRESTLFSIGTNAAAAQRIMATAKQKHAVLIRYGTWKYLCPKKYDATIITKFETNDAHAHAIKPNLGTKTTIISIDIAQAEKEK